MDRRTAMAALRQAGRGMQACTDMTGCRGADRSSARLASASTHRTTCMEAALCMAADSMGVGMATGAAMDFAAPVDIAEPRLRAEDFTVVGSLAVDSRAAAVDSMAVAEAVAGKAQLC
jgi:hypothetical protein